MIGEEPIRGASKNESFEAIWNIKIENNVKTENKMEENVKNTYAMIFKEFCLHHMQNIIKEHSKYDSIIHYPFNLMNAIAQSMRDTIL